MTQHKPIITEFCTNCRFNVATVRSGGLCLVCTYKLRGELMGHNTNDNGYSAAKHDDEMKGRAIHGNYPVTAGMGTASLAPKKERGAVEQAVQELGLALEVLDMNFGELSSKLSPIREQSTDKEMPDREIPSVRGSSQVTMNLKEHLDRVLSLTRRVKEIREEIEL